MRQLDIWELEWGGSLSKVFSVQKWMWRLYVFLLFITGSAQQVQLMPFSGSSIECRDGSVIDGKDQVVMTGSVTTAAPYPIVIEFQKRVSGGTFTFECVVSIASNGSCVSQSMAPCYCQSISGTTYNLVYNKTADKRDSSATLLLRFGTDATQAMPVVHSVGEVSVTVDGAAPPIALSDVCNEDFLAGKMPNFMICARNFEGIDFSIVTDKFAETRTIAMNNCSSFNNVELPNTGSLTFEYQETTGCGRNNSLNCTISGPVSDDPCSTGCIIGIVVGCVVVVVVIIVVIVVCVKKKSRAKSQNKENGNTGMAVEVIEVTIIISVDASRKQLVEKVKEKLSKDDQNTLTEPLEFTYKGEKMDHENWRLKEHFPKYKGDLVLIVIVHLDRSSLCEIKEVKEKASSGGSGSGGNNAVRDSRM